MARESSLQLANELIIGSASREVAVNTYLSIARFLENTEINIILDLILSGSLTLHNQYITAPVPKEAY